MRLAATLILCLAAPAAALDLPQCNRVTHRSHGGEAMHQDLGHGRVAWMSWWAQEGVYTDLHVAECSAQRVMISRLREHNIKPRSFDRLADGQDILARHLRRAAALFALEDLAQDLEPVGHDTRIEPMGVEVCGCAAAYPETRGDLTPFELEDVRSVTGGSL